MIQVWLPFPNHTNTNSIFKSVILKRNVDLQRLRDAPVENEDAFQHIDDDMLAQVGDYTFKCKFWWVY